VIEGRVVGSWTREIKKDRVDIHVVPLTRFDREQLRGIQDAAKRYGKFLGLAAKVNES
jgi:hypothetical protein